MEAIELSVYEAIYKRRIKITNKNWDEENTKLFIKYIFHCNNHQLIKILETSDKEKGSQNMIQKRLIMTDWNFGELFFLELFKNKNIYNRREEVYMCDMIYKVGPILTAKAHKGRGTPQVKAEYLWNIYKKGGRIKKSEIVDLLKLYCEFSALIIPSIIKTDYEQFSNYLNATDSPKIIEDAVRGLEDDLNEIEFINFFAKGLGIMFLTRIGIRKMIYADICKEKNKQSANVDDDNKEIIKQLNSQRKLEVIEFNKQIIDKFCIL